jgi:hypothetical protein
LRLSRVAELVREMAFSPDYISRLLLNTSSLYSLTLDDGLLLLYYDLGTVGNCGLSRELLE